MVINFQHLESGNMQRNSRYICSGQWLKDVSPVDKVLYIFLAPQVSSPLQNYKSST
jgi:hypothetical protein